MISRPLSLTLLACVASATLALAHEGATGVVKERMDLMETQKDAMKVIGEMAKGKTPFDAAAATKAAGDITSTAKKIPELTASAAVASSIVPGRNWRRREQERRAPRNLGEVGPLQGQCRRPRNRLRCAHHGARRQRERRMEARVSEGRRSL